MLSLFLRCGPELTQSQIGEALQLPLPTVHRLVGTLEGRGFVARDEHSRLLRLGHVFQALSAPQAWRATLRALAAETGETVNLAALDGVEVVYLASESGDRLLSARTPPGLRLPAHCTALGKCLLSRLPARRARELLGAEPYERRTPHTRTSWRRLAADLARTRRDGFVVSNEEFEVGLVSIAVPAGELAVNLSLPASRATPAERRRLTCRLLQAAGALR